MIPSQNFKHQLYRSACVGLLLGSLPLLAPTSDNISATAAIATPEPALENPIERSQFPGIPVPIKIRRSTPPIPRSG
ncbi:hypothetical protein CKA32_006290 [Geitlerinema sp. FC II]|nr:hypothetical protein CKA32_006290 [Geitlerinema sp. FC II]